MRRGTRGLLSGRAGLAVVAIAALLVLAVVLTSIRVNPTRPDRPIIIATSQWPPYVGSELPDEGPMAELVRLVLASQGYAARIDFTTWDLALKRVERGQALAAFPLVISAERDADFLASDPLVEFDYALFYDTSRPQPDLENPGQLTVGRIAGYDYWAALDDTVGSFQDYPTSAAAFQALGDGEVDLVAEGHVAGIVMLRGHDTTLDASRFATLDSQADWTQSTQGLHLMVERSNAGERFLEDFNESLAAIKDTSEYRDLIAALDPSFVSERVTLVSVDGDLATLQPDDGAAEIQLPAGSSAQVLDWHAAPNRALIKVLSGPHQGRVGTVAWENLEITP